MAHFRDCHVSNKDVVEVSRVEATGVVMLVSSVIFRVVLLVSSMVVSVVVLLVVVMCLVLVVVVVSQVCILGMFLSMATSGIAAPHLWCWVLLKVLSVTNVANLATLGVTALRGHHVVRLMGPARRVVVVDLVEDAEQQDAAPARRVLANIFICWQRVV